MQKTFFCLWFLYPEMPFSTLFYHNLSIWLTPFYLLSLSLRVTSFKKPLSVYTVGLHVSPLLACIITLITADFNHLFICIPLSLSGKFFEGTVFNSFLDITPNTQVAKEKLDQLNFIKIKFSASNEHYLESQNITIEWEKIVSSHISDKGLLSKIHNELI